MPAGSRLLLGMLRRPRFPRLQPNLWNTLRRLLAEQAGQTLAELSMLLSVVAVVVVLSAVLVFRDNIAEAFDGVSGCLQGACFELPGHCTDNHGDDGNQNPCNS